MNYYKIPAEQLEQNLNDVLKMTGDTFCQHDAKLPVVGSLFSQRKIKFRGQTIGGFWVYGNLSLLPKRVKNIEAGSYISNAAGLPFAYNVRPETVTQFTGLKDKNGKGKNIYEADIFNNTNKTAIGIVSWYKDQWVVKFPTYQYSLYQFLENDETREVIGNIFENTELLQTLR